MSARKNTLPSQHLLDAEDMSQLQIVSPVTNVQYLDNIGMQINFSGSPEGNFSVQVSADYQQDYLGNVSNQGNWITIASANTTGGSPIFFDINQTSSPYVRMVFDSTAIESGSVQAIADTGAISEIELTFLAKASMTEGEYLVLSDASGNDWAIAANISGSAPAPTGAIYAAIPSGRKAQVDLSSGLIVSAADVAAAFKAAFNALTGFSSALVLDDTAADGTMLVTSAIMGNVNDPQSLLEDDSGAGSITFVVNVIGVDSNLLNTYFIGTSTLANGTLSHWLIYCDVNGEGVAPADPDPDFTWTKVAAVINPSDSANSVAAAIKSAMDASLTLQLDTPVTNVGDLVSFDQLNPGPGSLEDSIAAPTGFTFVYNAVVGSMDYYITAKML